MRRVPILLCLLLLALALPVSAAPALRLEASTSRSEFLAGDRFTIAAHLFNDGSAPQLAAIGVQAPAGFDLIRSTPMLTTTPTILPGRALGVSWSYQVADTAPLGLARFVVVAFDDAGLPIPGVAREVVIRVGPVVAPPARAPIWRVYLPAFR